MRELSKLFRRYLIQEIYHDRVTFSIKVEKLSKMSFKARLNRCEWRPTNVGPKRLANPDLCFRYRQSARKVIHCFFVDRKKEFQEGEMFISPKRVLVTFSCVISSNRLSDPYGHLAGNVSNTT